MAANSEQTERSPVLKLNNGMTMPALGLGTWKSKPGEVREAIKDAIDVGYRHIDGAFLYDNEKDVGDSIRSKIDEGVIARDEMFVVSKLWSTYHRPEIVEEACRRTLKNLGLEYLDLYLMHTSMAYKEGPEFFPMVDGQIQPADYDYVDTWLAMENLVRLGLVRSIGVANFSSSQIKRILERGTIKPVTNQVECHPYLTQQKLSKFLKDNDIILTAYSPLGSPDRPWAKPEDHNILEDQKLADIAKKYGKPPAQILLRYQLDRGHAVIPKSSNKTRIAENFSVLDFALSLEDVELLNGFNRNERYFNFETSIHHKYHPFKNDEY